MTDKKIDFLCCGDEAAYQKPGECLPGYDCRQEDPHTAELMTGKAPEPCWADSSQEARETYRYDQAVTVFDVAAYIIKKMGAMSAMKLQKLVYYCQAWSLVWDEKPLFKERVEAWANGPVVRELFNFHRGQFQISSIQIGNPDLLQDFQRETIDAVLDYYGDKGAQWLIDLTRMEEPWKITRKGMPCRERGNRAISLDLIADYYSSLPSEE